MLIFSGLEIHLKFTLKRNSFFLFIFFFLGISKLFSIEPQFYSVNKIISYLNLDTEYDGTSGSLRIIKNDKSVTFYLNSSFILVGDKKKFINNFIKSEQGQFFIPTDTATYVLDYFKSEDKLQKNIFAAEEKSFTEKFITKNNEIYVEEKSGNDKNIEAEQGKFDDENDVSENIKKDSSVDIVKESKPKSPAEIARKILNENTRFTKINAIIIDPGHGGKDPGAIGYDDIQEKDIVLREGLLLAEKLRSSYPDKKIVMTRSKDVFIELEDRAALANRIYEKYGTTIFVSIHVNASRSEKVYGFETWHLVGNYNRKVVKQGAVSNDKSVENVVNSMLNQEIYRESRDLAGRIQANLEKQIGDVSVNRKIKEEVYFVIKKSVMPAVLVEIGFNTNKYEAIRLTKYSYLNKIATGIYSAVRDFINDYEKTKGFTR
jgi:N-acetylmuramoyl-L-alanine amidase